MVPLDEQNNVLLVRQYRKPAEAQLLEIPAGGIEPGEEAEEAVVRELQEEIRLHRGHAASPVQLLDRPWLDYRVHVRLRCHRPEES